MAKKKSLESKAAKEVFKNKSNRLVSCRIQGLANDLGIKQRDYLYGIKYEDGNKIPGLLDRCSQDGYDCISANALTDYWNGLTDIPVSILREIADFFSSIPDSKGHKHYVSTDYLIGRSDSYDEALNLKYITNMIGLDKDSIEQLRAIYEADKISVSNNRANIDKDKFIPETVKLRIVNHFLSSPILEQFCEAFNSYVDPKEYTSVLYKAANKDYTGIEYKHIPNGNIYLETPGGIMSKMPLDKNTFKAVSKNILIDLFHEYVNEYAENLEKEKEKEFKGIEKIWLDKGYTKEYINAHKEAIIQQYYDSF